MFKGAVRINGNHPYESARRRAQWVQGLFVAYIVLLLIQAPLLLILNSILSNTANEAALEEDPAYFSVFLFWSLLALLEIPLFIAMVVLFCMWVHRIHRNLPSLGAQDLKLTPGWAVGYYFIPIAHLFQPLLTAREAWKASDPEVEKEPNTSWKSQTVSILIPIWWVTFIISNGISNGVGKMSMRQDGTIESSILINNLYIFSDLVDVVSALLAVLVVRKLTARQEERYRLLPQSEESRAWI